MKFGKEFRTHLEETLPEWRDKFLCYKPLKKLLKNLPTTADSFFVDQNFLHDQRPIDAAAASVAIVDGHGQPLRNNQPLIYLQEWFTRILIEELDKFNDFYVDKEEDFVIRFQELKERIEKVKEKSSKGGIFTSESEFSEEIMSIRRDFVSIHGEMVLLKNYSSLNFAGLVKILKKYDKRTGGLLRLPFTQLVLHQPFFTIEPITSLVRECEENLDLLFPLEAEVIESTFTSQDQTNPSSNVTTTVHSEAPSPLGEETMDIYRSTLAAMKTIRGLRKESSTCNPLSFSSLIQKQDDGALTAENSADDPSASSQNGEEPDQGGVRFI